MNKILSLISRLVQSTYLRPESGHVLRETLKEMTIFWDITDAEIDKLHSEITTADTSSVTFEIEELRGQFFDLAIDLAARMLIEQACHKHPNYDQAKRVYHFYTKLCDKYYIQSGCC